MTSRQSREFDKVAADASDVGLVREIVYFLRQNKKWWLLPVLLILLPLGLLLILSGTAVAPFIYTLF